MWQHPLQSQPYELIRLSHESSPVASHAPHVLGVCGAASASSAVGVLPPNRLRRPIVGGSHSLAHELASTCGGGDGGGGDGLDSSRICGGRIGDDGGHATGLGEGSGDGSTWSNGGSGDGGGGGGLGASWQHPLQSQPYELIRLSHESSPVASHAPHVLGVCGAASASSAVGVLPPNRLRRPIVGGSHSLAHELASTCGGGDGGGGEGVGGDGGST